MYLQHPLLTGFRSWPDQCETSRYEVFPGSPQGWEHQSYSRIKDAFFSSKVANIKFIQRCLFFLKGCERQIHSKDALVVWNFRPHVVLAQRLAKLKRPTDFISKYFWAKIKELGISNRLSVIFPKKADTGIKFLLSKIQIACLSHFTHQMCWRRSFSFILFFNLHLHHKMIETTVSKYIPLLCVSL